MGTIGKRALRIGFSVGLVTVGAITLGWVAKISAQTPAPVQPLPPARVSAPQASQAPAPVAKGRSASPTDQSATLPPANATPAVLPKPIHTRQQEFSIPYRMTPNNSAREVHLFASPDQGRKWYLISRAQPHVHSFRYRAPADGEYWFAVRTLHDGGKQLPTGPLQAELRVVVDTVAPRLDLVAERGGRGDVRVRWLAVDPNLKLDSLQIETRSSANEPWKAVAIGQPPASLQTTRTGEETFFPPAGTGAILVRASVVDGAGNRSINQAEAQLGGHPPTGNASLVSRPGDRPSAGRYASETPVAPVGVTAQPAVAPARNSDGSQTWPADVVGAGTLGQ